MKSIFGLMLLFFGVIQAINPEVAWQLEIGWKVKDTEPSDTYLLYTRIVGIVLSISGLILILIW